MSTGPKRLPPHFQDAQLQLDRVMDALRVADPRRYAEQLAHARALDQRAEHWRTHEVRLPRGVEVVPMLDANDRLVHAIEWGRTPSPAPPAFLHDRAMAIELVWTVFMLRRPWAIDDDRLRELVDRPPLSPARILGELLSIRFADWVRDALGTMANACIETPPPDHGIEALEDVFRSFAAQKLGFEGRATVSIHELTGLLDVAEPDAGLGHETSRWRWMLHDYTLALDPALHEHLEALAVRFDVAEPKDVGKAWNDLLDCRQLDACLGLVLARAAMLDPRSAPTIVQGFVDPMATRAAGSFAWWCRVVLDAWDDEYPLGDRLRAEEIETFMGFARYKLEELDPGLLAAVLRVFPVVAG